MSQAPMDARQALETKLFERAMTDVAFRHELLRDPQAALAGMAGVIPAHYRIQVLEEHQHSVYLVVPPADTPPD
ncbi:MAG TPA: hypothetical protein VM536_00800 [Chloroflexia bacterium]|nr:hypothetical protein [Chloroflexia bacterium]